MVDVELILDAQVFLEALKARDPREMGTNSVFDLDSSAELVYRLFCAYLTSCLSDRLISDIRAAVEQYRNTDEWLDQAHQDGFLDNTMDMLRRVLVELRIERATEEEVIPY